MLPYQLHISTNIKFMLMPKKNKRNLHCNMIYDVTHHRHLLNTCFNVIERNNNNKKISADRHRYINYHMNSSGTHMYNMCVSYMCKCNDKKTNNNRYVNE